MSDARTPSHYFVEKDQQVVILPLQIHHQKLSQQKVEVEVEQEMQIHQHHPRINLHLMDNQVDVVVEVDPLVVQLRFLMEILVQQIKHQVNQHLFQVEL